MIKLLGPLVCNGYQYFATVFYLEGHWLILQEGWEYEGLIIQVFTNILDPHYTGEPVSFEGVEVVRVYTNRKEYFAECALRSSELYEKVPCPDWAVACRITT